MAQVLHGVAPGRARESREGRALGGVREQLQRLLVEAEAQALQRELGLLTRTRAAAMSVSV